MFSFWSTRHLLTVSACAILLSGTTPAAMAAVSVAPGGPAAELCYSLAADPEDPGTWDSYSGIATKDVTEAAITACDIASLADPENAQISYLLGRANYARGKYDAALQAFEVSAAGSYGAAERALGDMYAQGKGVERDDDIALSHYQNAADLGQPVGLVGAIKRYVAEGEGLADVLDLLQQAGTAGSGEAWTMIGRLFVANPGDVDPGEVETALMIGFATDVPEAGIELGRFYDRSGNATAALAIYEQLVVKENATAMYEMSRRTEGELSGRWLLAAANRDEPDAMYVMALNYKNGTGGVEADSAVYLEWLNKAAEAENASAMTELGNNALAAKSPDYAAARSWFERAVAIEGDVDAYLALASIYDRGRGTDVDRAKAYYYYSSAIGAGDVKTAYFYRAQISDSYGPLISADKAAADLMAASADGPVAKAAAAGLREFSKNTKIAVQELLAADGHYDGKIDGVFGPKAIAGFAAHLAAED